MATLIGQEQEHRRIAQRKFESFAKKKKKWNQIIEWRKNVFAFKFLWEQEAREKEDEMVRTAAEAAHVER